MSSDHTNGSNRFFSTISIVSHWPRVGLLVVCVVGGLIGCSSMDSRFGLSSLMPHSVTTGQSEPDVDYEAERAAQAREERQTQTR